MEELNQILNKQQRQVHTNISDLKSKDEIKQLVGFMIDNEEYAIPILSIQEIIKPIEYTRVPSVPDYVLGVFNMRGNVIPLIDLAKKFGLASSKQTQHTRYIVLRGEEGSIGFVIDKLTEAIKIKASNIDQPPETLLKEKGMIEGIGKQKNGILTILKVEALMKRDF
ncbi:chemotaxis protein CheW [Campylobacter sp. MG1]|uniref:chemotaxis protein CheW n=1 Tax=Campylobacter sp. MG1 TaxID=2976332 RepID=UPI00226C80AF|nr:chemotaxis protein CheW [Campylobacter sp. MG1]